MERAMAKNRQRSGTSAVPHLMINAIFSLRERLLFLRLIFLINHLPGAAERSYPVRHD